MVLAFSTVQREQPVKGNSFCYAAALLIGLPAFGGSAQAEIATDGAYAEHGQATSGAMLPLAFDLGFSLPKPNMASIGVTSFRDPQAEPEESVTELPSSSVQEGTSRPGWTDHVPRSASPYPTFGSQVHRIKWESLGALGYFTAVNSPKFFKETTSLHFKNEGWFGKSTENLGVDKLTHAFDSYILAEILHARLHAKTDAASGDALTAAVLATGLMFYSELYDGIETDSGISLQDMVMNAAGATFSLLRNTTPGLREKLDFRLLLMPNSDIYTRTGKRHYAQQRYLLALQLAGFQRFEGTPLRFVELHAGYYASGFTSEDIARGERPRRHLFFGIGINLRELFLRAPRSTAGRVVGVGLDYIQLPYTAAHWK
ncbi:DUF2279 domain-containing protein [Rhizorhabdus argentea]|uniref:DUF2279 domain-containing protein n=1 Tax=Rhizorhabdus argentea TaxID=1387174 RepID=UPI0030EE5F1D